MRPGWIGRAIGISMCLQLGTVITVAVAWTASIIEQSERYTVRWTLATFSSGNGPFEKVEPDSWPMPTVPPDWPARPTNGYREGGWTWSYLRTVASIPEIPAKSIGPVAPNAEPPADGLGALKQREYFVADQFAYGFPFRGLVYWGMGRVPAWVSGGAHCEPGRCLSGPRVKRWTGVELLPVVPIWPGFALNTLFYATIVWGLWQVPLAIRRRARRRKNRCVQCGYDRAGLAMDAACPECGEVR